MKEQYLQLTNDLKEASKLAIEAASKIDDGGSANLDSVFMRLKGFREQKTIEAIHAAGLSGFKTIWFGMAGFIVNPPCVGQGNKRNIAMETMIKFLKDKYNCFGFYQMD